MNSDFPRFLSRPSVNISELQPPGQYIATFLVWDQDGDDLEFSIWESTAPFRLDDRTVRPESGTYATFGSVSLYSIKEFDYEFQDRYRLVRMKCYSSRYIGCSHA